MIRLALLLLPYSPGFFRPWLLGIALGKKPIRAEFRDGKWRAPQDSARVGKALEENRG